MKKLLFIIVVVVIACVSRVDALAQEEPEVPDLIGAIIRLKPGESITAEVTLGGKPCFTNVYLC